MHAPEANVSSPTLMEDLEGCKTVENLEAFESKLKCPEYFAKCVSCTKKSVKIYSLIINLFQVVSLQLIGGKDVADIIRKILSKILENNAAKSLNWTGRNGKKSFLTFENVLSLITSKFFPCFCFCVSTYVIILFSICKEKFKMCGDNQPRHS